MKASLARTIKKQTNKIVRTLPGYVEDFIFENKDAKQPQTLLGYTRDITLLFDYLKYIGEIDTDDYTDVPVKTFDKLTTRDIQRFLDYLEDYEKEYTTTNGKIVIQNFQNSTFGKSRKLAAIREWFNYLEEKKLIEKNVAKTVKFKVQKRGYIKERLSTEQIKKLFTIPEEDESNKKIHAQHVALRNVTIMKILAYSGIRVSELVQLDIDDLLLNEETMLIIRKGGKKEKIDLAPQIIEQLEKYLPYRKTLEAKTNEDKNALFLSMQRKRPNTRSIRDMLKKAGEEAEIPFNVTPHVLRRTFGTNHYNQNQDMYLTASVLGHSSADTTKNHYVAIDENRKRSSIKNFEY